ncbi:MAG: DUF5719 family protein [Actinomycetota bacterium]|nr:DUF5719 family protein [Actinomycetota bacterium]
MRGKPLLSKILVLFIAAAVVLAMGGVGITDAVIKTVNVGSNPWSVGVNPTTNKIYVANAGSNTVSVIDGSTDTVSTTVGVGWSPQGVGVNPTTNKIYVSNYLENMVSVIDGSTDTVLKTIGMPGPRGVGVNPTTNKIYVSNYLENMVSVIDGSTDTVSTTVGVGWSPQGVGVNPTTNKIYVTNGDGNTVSVIDGSTDTVSKRVGVGIVPAGVGVNPTTNKIYVANSIDSTVSVIDGSTDTVSKTLHLRLGSYPIGVGVNPTTNKIYVANFEGRTVSVIDGSTDTVSETIGVGNEPVGVGVNPNTDKIYVANSRTNTVSVIWTSPSVDTDAATSVGTITATLNGEITDTGGEDADERGFRWREQGAGSWTDWSEAGTFGTGTFNYPVSGLTEGTAYEYQALAHNSFGWTYGFTETFTTIGCPAVATKEASGITHEGATLNGEITGTGGEDADERGFRWREQGAGTWTDWSETGTFGTGTFSHAVSGLTEGTAYEYQASAHNSAGWAYGATETFTTIDYPSVDTDAATSVGPTGATLEGEITGTGGEDADERGFRWREQGAGTWTDWSEAGTFGAGTYNHAVSGLSDRTTYEYQASAHNSAGWAYGATETFTTIDYPSVDTDPATSVGPTGATLEGEITDTGGEDCSRGFDWREQGSPTWDNGWEYAGTYPAGTYSHAIGSLTRGTTYEFRAKARNSASDPYWEYGETVDFTTIYCPSVDTDPATSVGPTGATLEGEIIDTGGEDCSRGFDWREQGSPTWNNGWEETGAFGTGTFSHAVTGLAEGADYEFRAKAKNSASDPYWEYGATETFITIDYPLVDTDPATSVGPTGATLEGEIIDTGGEDCSRGFDWREKGSPTWDNGWEEEGTHPVEPYSHAVGSLTPGTTYEFRAKARNSASDPGWEYGSTETFTTIGRPAVVTGEASGITHEGATLAGEITAVGDEDADRRGFRFREQGSGSWTEWSEAGAFGAGTFSHEVSGLFEGTAYEYQATAHNSAGWAYGDTGTFETAAPSYAFYFAEGCTGAGFQEYICLGNPGEEEATATITYLFPDGDTSDQQVSIPALSRTTINVNGMVGPDREVSARVVSPDPIVAERPMYFVYEGAWSGGHDVVGSTSTSENWYFAEGYTGAGFSEWICVLNPGGEDAEMTFSFQTQEEGLREIGSLSVPAHSRRSFSADQLLGQGSYQTSLGIESSSPVVAERSMYFSYSGTAGWGWEGGHCVMGAPALEDTYYFAEGTTRDNFECWLTLQNPNQHAVSVEATYQPGPGQGAPVLKTYEVEANSRRTLYVPDEAGKDKDVSILLTCADKFLAERPIYFSYSYEGLTAQGGHCVIGASAPAADWFLAEGYTGAGYNEWICMQNPGDTEATVAVTYYTQESGPLAPVTVTVSPGARNTLMVNRSAGEGYQLSVGISSDVPIVVERPMYFNTGPYAGGHDVVGYAP